MKRVFTEGKTGKSRDSRAIPAHILGKVNFLIFHIRGGLGLLRARAGRIFHIWRHGFPDFESVGEALLYFSAHRAGKLGETAGGYRGETGKKGFSLNKTHGLWGIAALAALSMTACGGGDTRYGTDGTMTGGGTSSAPAYDNAYDNGTTNGTTYGNAYDNGTTYGSAYDDGMMTDNYNRTTGNGAYGANGKTYDARDNDGVTDFGDTGRAYDNGNTNRSLLESASDALENGVQRARDGLSTHS